MGGNLIVWLLAVLLTTVAWNCAGQLLQSFDAGDHQDQLVERSADQQQTDTQSEMSGIKTQLELIQKELREVKQLLRVSTATADIQSRRSLKDALPSQQDLVSRQSLPHDCADLMALGIKSSDVYTVYIGRLQRAVQVYCDMTTDGGGWTVFQRRLNGRVNFYRTWAEYAAGFGNVNGEFWLGNDNLHLLTTTRNYRLRIDLQDFEKNAKYAEYSDFKVASACEKYKLTSAGTYCGNAADSLSYHVGMKFSTRDEDNDLHKTSCAVQYKGAWWYNACHYANLNGFYYKGPHSSYADGVNWYHWKGYHYSLGFTEMKIRPNDM